MNFTSPTQYLFLTVSPSKNTKSVPTTSTESTRTSPSTSPYVTKTDFAATIKDLLSNFDSNAKETIEETITDQDENFDTKFEKQLQTLSLHIKEDSTKFSSKLGLHSSNVKGLN